ncbi:MAG: efflux RND transporter periplasmic adaptor subunit [Rudaea sp.]|uniref:efflux RND transporter periplasmic adaptor subunit n=1 Tax=unclassified Rudaea TaxID=2627037 RepID=UPI0010F5DB31|nr:MULTISPECIES: efflux RND transporter periplasmic adaptor subunit [unclassified Rudaea]MBN8885486.1 efflux RND transporter periplasmic adaptor subunit [Rudaea sp.]
MSQLDTPNKPVSRRGLRLTGIAAAVVAAVIVAHGLIVRASESSRLHDWTEAQALATVAVNPPTAVANTSGLELPGRIEAWQRAPIYARVSGYLKDWKHDIGTQVKAGEVLANIETPDLDQQLLQAKADLATAQANAALSATTAKRWQAMLGSDSVSKQEVDEKTGDLAAKNALVAAQRANVDRLVALKNFTRIVAPFDGTVTTRNTDVGALINVGGGAGQELFVVSDTSKLRVYVNVPQNYVPSVRPGTKATLSVPDQPDKSYAATVESSAQAVNAASGTTLMQLSVDNAAGELLPGGFANVRLAMAGKADALSVPGSALIFDAKGISVATVDANNKVVVKPVTIARDLGKVVEIGSGLTAADRVIENPPDGVVTGTEVRIAGAQSKTQVASAGNGKNGKG